MRLVCAGVRAVAAPAAAAPVRRHLHSSLRALREFVVPVPQMAESITEGTVAQVLKLVGQPVALDEIVCVIETDKVAFEVRAPEAGVVKSVAVAAGQTVGVGAPLLVLDTDGAAALSSSAAPPQAAAPAAAPSPAPAPAAVPAPPAAPPAGRVPSIRFRHGARDAINAELGHGAGSGLARAPAVVAAAQAPAGVPPPAGSYAEQTAKAFPSKAGGRTYLDLPPAFGRPRISEAEARAIESGGAF